MNEQSVSIAACVLAAGQSTRMGRDNKLLSSLKGKTLLQHVLHSIQDSGINDICVITGHESEQVSESISKFNVNIIHNKNYLTGLSTSIGLGVDNLSKQTDGVLICLGDMPFISATTIKKIIAAFKSNDDIVVPTFCGQDGNPLLWSRSYFAKLKNLKGDRGAKYILKEYPQHVHRVDVDNIGIVLDVDDTSTLEFFRSKLNN